jgi:SfnB family sulfur acquisition oxidoreductase
MNSPVRSELLATPSDLRNTDRARALAPPTTAAHRIGSDAEALDVARQLAAQFKQSAVRRDRERLLPWDELEACATSGLLASRVPKSHGGAQIRFETLAEVVAIVSEADPSIGQLFLSIVLATGVIDAVGRPEQKNDFFGKILFGYRWGNGHAEGGGDKAGVTKTRVTRQGDRYVVNGQKFYSTGAYYSSLISVGAVDEDGRSVTAVIDRHAPGLTIHDDWDGFGQRTTASGTLDLDHVVIERSHLLESERARTAADSTVFGVTDLVHSAIDLGIARAVLADSIDYVNRHARAHTRAGIEKAAEDPYILEQLGEVITRVESADAVLSRAARWFDEAAAAPDQAKRDRATYALSQARVLTTEAAILATNKIFQLGGASATRAEHAFDRHWRNARTHTVHDPVHWRFPAIARHHLAARL